MYNTNLHIIASLNLYKFDIRTSSYSPMYNYSTDDNSSVMILLMKYFYLLKAYYKAYYKAYNYVREKAYKKCRYFYL